MRKLKQLLIAAFVVVGTLFITAVASASGYTKVLPNGLSSNSSAAKQQIQQLVANDSEIQKRLATDNGISTDEIAGAVVSSVSKTKVTIGKDADNSARAMSNGAIVPTSYMDGQTVTAWKVTLKISETKTVVVKWKKDCSNPFLKKGKKRPPLRITKKVKTFTFPFKKSKTTSRTVVCPSGQQVTVTVVSTVKGKVRVKSLTKGVQLMSQKMTARISIDVTNAIKVTCGATTPPPTTPPPPYDACVNIEGNQSSIPNGMNLVAGNCVHTKQECGEGSHWSDSVQSCVVTICGNTVIVNGDGNNINPGGNCNQNPPPVCPSGTTGTPPACVPVDACPNLPGVQPVGADCDHPPVVNIMGSPAHLYVGGNAYVWIEASDPDGDTVSVKVSASGSGTVAGLVPSAIRWDGTACPSGKKCYRATVWAGSTPGNLTVTATVTAGGKSDSDSATFPVKADDFG